MTKLTWDDLSERTYNYGVSKVVLYSSDGVSFAKWPGVTSIKETVSGSDFESDFFDGHKFYNYPSTGSYEADVSAFSFPKQFLRALGVKETRPGFFLTNQDKEIFHMVYQTETSYGGYKIHLVSNIVSTRSSSENKTLNDSVEPETFTFKFSAIPVKPTENLAPYSKVVVDSEKVDPSKLSLIENYIYGTESENPMFPIGSLFVNI